MQDGNQNKKYLLDIAVEDVLSFEKGLFEFIDTKYPEIPSYIRENKVNCRTETRIKHFCFQINLSIGNRNYIRRDISGTEIPSYIRENKVMDEATENKLVQAIKEYKTQFIHE